MGQQEDKAIKNQGWTDSDWPDWTDDGKRVACERPDGLIISGTLEVEDSFFTGEEEVPIFTVLIDGGGGFRFPFCESKRWRFI